MQSGPELTTEKQMKQTSKRVTEEMIMNSQNKISQSQKLMVFVLSMSLYGLATLFTELIPSFQVGIAEFSVEYVLVIPLTRAMLFDPLSAGLGAATGELVFSEIMLGQFGGLGELEKFITVTIGVYIAGRLVKNPRNRAVVAGASIFGVFIQLGQVFAFNFKIGVFAGDIIPQRAKLPFIRTVMIPCP